MQENFNLLLVEYWALQPTGFGTHSLTVKLVVWGFGVPTRFKDATSPVGTVSQLVGPRLFRRVPPADISVATVGDLINPSKWLIPRTFYLLDSTQLILTKPCLNGIVCFLGSLASRIPYLRFKVKTLLLARR